jgi:hypothetical protein
MLAPIRVKPIRGFRVGIVILTPTIADFTPSNLAVFNNTSPNGRLDTIVVPQFVQEAVSSLEGDFVTMEVVSHLLEFAFQTALSYLIH